jgi:hypothetical protein
MIHDWNASDVILGHGRWPHRSVFGVHRGDMLSEVPGELGGGQELVCGTDPA